VGSDAQHPDAERLAEYADGLLPADARTEIERHLIACPDCRTVVAETMVFAERDVRPFRSRPWVRGVAATLAAAAVLFIAARVVRPSWLERIIGSPSDGPELQALIAALGNAPDRPVDARLPGGFKYAPARSPVRGARESETSPDVRIAAAKIEKLAQQGGPGSFPEALGMAYLALGRPDRTVAVLESSPSPSTNALTTLAAAYLARGDTGDAQRAVGAARKALDRSPADEAAAFNYALALERANLLEEARRAWQAYIALDAQSGWAAEARQHLGLQ
jgi:tetratricopeptide (TPR) repeat protein